MKLTATPTVQEPAASSPVAPLPTLSLRGAPDATAATVDDEFDWGRAPETEASEPQSEPDGPAWYVHQHDTTTGPYPFSTLSRMFIVGDIVETASVSPVGSQVWQPISALGFGRARPVEFDEPTTDGPPLAHELMAMLLPPDRRPPVDASRRIANRGVVNLIGVSADGALLHAPLQGAVLPNVCHCCGTATDHSETREFASTPKLGLLLLPFGLVFGLILISSMTKKGTITTYTCDSCGRRERRRNTSMLLGLLVALLGVAATLIVTESVLLGFLPVPILAVATRALAGPKHGLRMVRTSKTGMTLTGGHPDLLALLPRSA